MFWNVPVSDVRITIVLFIMKIPINQSDKNVNKIIRE